MIQRRQLRRRAVDLSVCHLEGLPPLLQRLYAARGIRDATDLDHRLAGLPDPAGMHGVAAACELLSHCLVEQQRILVVGDYDADGATSAALAVLALRAMGAVDVDFIVPDRFTMGYGLSPALVEAARPRAPDVLLTVDNGIASVDGVAAANACGMQVIVTDHHLPGEELPAAAAIVNPRQPACNWPGRNLAGVGVVFFLMVALRAHLRGRGYFAAVEPNLAEMLDLVAIGTVADLVPLDRLNRILVSQGLARMRAGKLRPGVRALLAGAGRDASRLVSADIGFGIGPRLNAAGRLDDMGYGIRCLLSEDEEQAVNLAGRLEQMNRERRDIETGMREAAEAVVGAMQDEASGDGLPASICLYDANWHQGVVGLVASRIKDRWHRPVVAFADAGNGQLRGSGRSIPGMHLRDALAAVDARHPGLIDRFGGHAMAAGLSMAHDGLETFRVALLEEVSARVTAEQLQAVLLTDGELSCAELALEQAEQLRSAGPWGQQFPEPCFDGRFEVLQQRLLGDKHLKMVLCPPGNSRLAIDAIAFRVDTSRWPDAGAREVDIVYRLEVNEYRGRRSLQLVVEDLWRV